MFNKIAITGRLTKDPRTFRFGKNSVGCMFSLASNRKFRNNRKDRTEQETTFVRVYCYGRLAENVMTHLSKARFCFVDGRLEQRLWRDRDNNLHIMHYIAAASVNWDFPDDPNRQTFRKKELAKLRKQVRQLRGDTYIERKKVGGESPTDEPQILENPNPSKRKQGDTFFIDDGPISVIESYLDDDPDPIDKEPKL